LNEKRVQLRGVSTFSGQDQMETTKIKIGVICSFSTQQKVAEKVSHELSRQVEILAEFGVLEDVIPLAKCLERRGAEAIITWKATAAVLKKHLSIPTIGIRIPYSDIMQAVEQATCFGKEIALVVTSHLSEIDLLEKLHNVSIKQIVSKNMDDLRYGIAEACNEGCEVIIGKSSAVLDITQKYSIKTVFIPYNPGSVKDAFGEAIKIVDFRRKEREKYVHLQGIFDSLTDGVIVTNDKGKVTLFNLRAQNILGMNAQDILGQSINSILPHNQVIKTLRYGANVDDDFVVVENTNISVSYRFILNGKETREVVIILREVSEVQKLDSKIRRQMNRQGFIAHYTIDHFSAKSAASKQVVEQIKSFATTDSTILIVGESGTGKEIIAQSIHNLSPRSRKPFVAINCSVFPETLLESEIFGYEGGAFTGAKKGGKMGVFELSHKGTILLDEISTMPVSLQSKLLRILQEREVMRLGGEQLIPIDVRIIAASNKDLGLAIMEGSFREDLYFRLNILTIRVPPLRERKEDIRDIVLNLLSYYCEKHRKNNVLMSSKALRELESYYWPGNVRQLESIVERLVLLSDGSIELDTLLRQLLDQEITLARNHQQVYVGATLPEATKQVDEGPLDRKTIMEYERERMVKVLSNVNFNKSLAASILGMSRSKLYRKMRAYELL